MELIVHQHPAQTAQYFQVDILSPCRRRNQEKQKRRLFIQAFIVYPGPDDHTGQPGGFHRFRFCMGDGDPLPDTGAAFRFPCQHPGFVQRLISQVAPGLHQVHKALHCRRLISDYSI